MYCKKNLFTFIRGTTVYEKAYKKHIYKFKKVVGMCSGVTLTHFTFHTILVDPLICLSQTMINLIKKPLSAVIAHGELTATLRDTQICAGHFNPVKLNLLMTLWKAGETNLKAHKITPPHTHTHAISRTHMYAQKPSLRKDYWTDWKRALILKDLSKRLKESYRCAERNICIKACVLALTLLPYSCTVVLTWYLFTHVVHDQSMGSVHGTESVWLVWEHYMPTLGGWPHPSQEILLAPSDFLSMCVVVLSVHLSITPSLSIYHVHDHNYPPKRPLPLRSNPSSQWRWSAGSSRWASRLNMAFPVKDTVLPLTSSTSDKLLILLRVVELGDFPLHLIAYVKSPRWVFRR